MEESMMLDTSILDLCISYTPGNIRALKFSQYIEDNYAKEIIQRLYNLFTKARYFCPEIAVMKQKKGIRLKWADDGNYINASLYYDNLKMIYYTYGNHQSFHEETSDISEDGIQKFINERQKQCPTSIPVPYVPITRKKKLGI